VKLTHVYAPIAADLESVRSRLREDVRALVAQYSGHSVGGLTLSAIEHLFEAKGKSLRPALLLLSAGVTRPGGYERREAIQRAAGIVELIHSASLIHDDVIDESVHRRRIPSVHSKYGIKIAILAGDILFSHGFDVLSSLPETPEAMRLDLLGSFAGLTKQMCSGEIFEQQSAKGTDSIDRYIDIIELKTARLMSVSCLVGSVLAGGDKGERAACEDFGLNFGVAYQLVDDFKDRDSIFTGDMDYLARAREYMDRATCALSGMQQSVFRESLAALCEFVFE
jgi:geranylgeranyl pyrophosphate synthase